MDKKNILVALASGVFFFFAGMGYQASKAEKIKMGDIKITQNQTVFWQKKLKNCQKAKWDIGGPKVTKVTIVR